MQTYHDLRPLCDQIHQEKLQEAERQRLVRQMKARREPREGGLRRAGLIWSGTMTPLFRGVKTTGRAVARAMRGTA